MVEVWLVRHGETEWSRDHRHTSTTDLPLTAVGEETAAELATRLAGESFDLVLASPRQRARRTAELAGHPGPELTEDLVEWDYGDYEGITTAEIRETVPGWSVWTHPVPGGESAAQVTDLAVAIGAMGLSLACQVAGKGKWGNFIAQWGGFGGGEGQFNFPYGIAVDSRGSVFAVDSGNTRVQQFMPAEEGSERLQEEAEAVAELGQVDRSTKV